MTITPAATLRARPLRRGLSSLIIIALLLCALAPSALTAAQSGRRKAAPQSPVPQPTPDEAKPAPAAAKNISIIASFIVYEDDNVNFSSILGSQRNLVGKSFYDRLKQSPSVEVSLGGRGTRGDARDRAKKESKAHVVLLQLEEDAMSMRDPTRRDRLGRTDPGDFAIRISVYTPTTAELKFNDIVHTRPYRSTGTIGGIPVPVPAGRYPGEYQLMQAARDAADRLLSRFEIARPPDN